MMKKFFEDIKLYFYEATQDKKHGGVSSRRVITVGGFMFLCLLCAADFAVNHSVRMDLYTIIASLITGAKITSTVEKHQSKPETLDKEH